MTEPRARALADAMEIAPDRPLLIVDADEVLFQFMNAFHAFIQSRGHAFVFRSYALNGNVLAHEGGPPLTKEEVGALVGGFFAERTAAMPPDPEAAPALRRLEAEGVQALVLSNVPESAANARREALAASLINLSLAPWSGPKGEAVKALAAKTSGATAFVDDIAHHHESVRDLAPDVHRLHYVTHPTLRELLGKVEAAHDQAESWPQLEEIIKSRIL